MTQKPSEKHSQINIALWVNHYSFSKQYTKNLFLSAVKKEIEFKVKGQKLFKNVEQIADNPISVTKSYFYLLKSHVKYFVKESFEEWRTATFQIKQQRAMWHFFCVTGHRNNFWDLVSGINIHDRKSRKQTKTYRELNM